MPNPSQLTMSILRNATSASLPLLVSCKPQLLASDDVRSGTHRAIVAGMAFRGWPAEALEFYEGLQADNSKAYWTSHKAVYEDAVLRPMQELTELLAPEFG